MAQKLQNVSEATLLPFYALIVVRLEKVILTNFAISESQTPFKNVSYMSHNDFYCMAEIGRVVYNVKCLQIILWIFYCLIIATSQGEPTGILFSHVQSLAI